LSGLPSIATRRTLDWIEAASPKERTRVLEVGCGAGELAAALGARGHEVVAIDSSPEAVRATSARGVDAREAVFPRFEAPPFDVVLFSRSLHHIEDLAGACRRARELARPGGLVLVEDWRWNEMDRATAEWIYGLMQVGQALGVVPADEWRHSGDPLRTWLEEHRERHLHEAAAMLASLREELTIEGIARAPYVYRWFVRYTAGRPELERLPETILDWESRSIDLGTIQALGLRVVACAD
jgi:SAM-dependent methyltransferase